MTRPLRRAVGAVSLSRSNLEDILANRLAIAGLLPFQREYRFAAPRRFRSDFAWPEDKLLVEVEGGIYAGGRHTRGSGFESDCHKYNTAALLGYRVLRFTKSMIESGEAIAAIREALR